MTNNSDDPLIAEIEKMKARYGGTNQNDNFIGFLILDDIEKLEGIVKADRARQQAEKEKMIADIKKAIWNNPDLQAFVLEIIQGKEQKEEREARE